MKVTADQQLVRRINRSLVLRLIRSQAGLSRAKLAAQIGLTKSTISSLVSELIEERWLTESPTTPALGMGRPSTPLQLDTQSRGWVGVEVAVGTLRVVAITLVGHVFWSLEELLLSKEPDQVCAQTARMVALANAQMQANSILLAGVGVGIPGAVDEAAGRVRFAPNLGWRDVDILLKLRLALARVGITEVAVHVQNEADTAALSEYEFSEIEAEHPLIFVTCDVGVGAGIVLNDRLFTGVHGMAGEIGHSILAINGPLCSCGRQGCVEAFIGASALSQMNDPSDGGRYLGVLLQNLCTTFDPGVLVLGGASCVAHPNLMQVAVAVLHQYAKDAGIPPPVVRHARYGLLAAAVGAAALVLHHDLRPMSSASFSGRPLTVGVPAGQA